MQDQTIASWLADLASRSPAPGGGAAAAMTAATAAALIGMVAEYTTGERWADRSERMQAVAAEAAELRGRALELAEADAVAFAEVGRAYALPKESDEERTAREAAIQTALRGAAQPPRRVGEVGLRIVELAAGLVEDGNPNVVSDVLVAASLAGAAIEAAIANVEINRSMLADPAVRAELDEAVGSLQRGIEDAAQVADRVRKGLQAA